ncbi:PREDICTED: uncharacterized protein LOC109184096 [Ipomoea nil]|uniref:uncharacterized protein LOC109184096 n=1 Tax=Ipomoea nil TaxID=35883 RepID=UPI000900B424|nr:PREDICTED: uncharacterized protein LOC109184096 [Ipomoea nil]
MRDLVSGVLTVSQAEDFGKYLGLPSVVGRNRRAVFAYIEQKLRQRFGSWNKRLLSKAGKEVLLKSVAQAMPTYTMSIYLIPITLCASLERLMNRYWWGHGGQGSSIHWLAWDRMCKPKKHGGMGFKRLHEFNLALLAKQGWRLLTNPTSLMARVFKARYFPTTSFYEAVMGGNPSYVWRSIMASQDLLKSGCRRRIGNGASTQVWTAPWLPDHQNPYIETDQVDHAHPMRVSDLIDSHTGTWNHEILHHLFNPRDVDLILRLPVCMEYEDIWRVDIINVCPLCGLVEECVMHIFCLCPYAINVWQLSQFQIPPFANRNFIQWTEEWLGGTTGFTREQQWKICGILHSIWTARNSAVWESAVPLPTMLIRRCLASWTSWVDSQQRIYGENSTRAVQSHASGETSAPSSRCFVDASFHGPERYAAFGFVVLDANSTFVAAANGPLSCPYDPLLAEAMAMCEALSWLKDNGYTGGEIYTDSAVLVLFINREANHVAHSLSKHVSALAERSFWRDVPPPFILPLVANAI